MIAVGGPTRPFGRRAGAAGGRHRHAATEALAGLVAAQLRPSPPYPAGPEAALLGATAMIDVSDGLVADLGHVAAASGVALDIDSSALVTGGPLDEAAAMLREKSDSYGRSLVSPPPPLPSSGC